MKTVSVTKLRNYLGKEGRFTEVRINEDNLQTFEGSLILQEIIFNNMISIEEIFGSCLFQCNTHLYGPSHPDFYLLFENWKEEKIGIMERKLLKIINKES